MIERRVNVRGIVLHEGKLLAQTFKQKDGTESSYWGTPGGGLDIGESLQEGLHREFIEETGIAPKIGKLLFIQQFRSDKNEQLEFFFSIENPEDYETIDLATTSHGQAEISRVGFVDPATNPIMPAFLQTIDIADYIASPHEVFLYNELETVKP